MVYRSINLDYVVQTEEQESIGRIFESWCNWRMARTKGSHFVDMTELWEDYSQGMDCFVHGVPIDWTLNFAKKGNVIAKAKMSVPCGDKKATWYIGIRTGNSHHGYYPFRQPVLVIGFADVNGRTWKANSNAISQMVRECLGKIVSQALKHYKRCCPMQITQEN